MIKTIYAYYIIFVLFFFLYISLFFYDIAVDLIHIYIFCRVFIHRGLDPPRPCPALMEKRRREEEVHRSTGTVRWRLGSILCQTSRAPSLMAVEWRSNQRN